MNPSNGLSELGGVWVILKLNLEAEVRVLWEHSVFCVRSEGAYLTLNSSTRLSSWLYNTVNRSGDV